jgi:hypothetical protein
LRQFADFKPNIDIYVNQDVINRLLERPILGGSIEKITLDNGVVGYRINYQGGYVNSQGVNLVLKPPNNDRRPPISNQMNAAGNVKVEFRKVNVYVAKENVLALSNQESIDFETLATLPKAEQVLQIARFLRFNALYNARDRSARSKLFSQETMSRLEEILSDIHPHDLASMPLDLSAAIGSEFLVAFLSNPEMIIHVINKMDPSLFPYLNRDNLQNKLFQEQLVAAFTQIPLVWRNPRSIPTLDTSLLTQKLINRHAVKKALSGINLGRRYEIESDITLTWEMSRPGDIVRLALLFCPFELTGRAIAKREVLYEPGVEHSQLFIGMTMGPHARHNYEDYLQRWRQ